MSLAVWLLLTKDTRNQGLFNLPTPWEGWSRDNNGKLGQYCYSDCAIYHITDEWLDNEWSLACWVKSSSWSQYNDILLCKNVSESTSSQFYFSIIGGTTLNLGINGGSGGVAYSYTFATNTWYHVAATYNGSIACLYINGVQVKSQSYATTKLNNMNNFCVGCRSTNSAGTSSTGNTGVKRLNDVRVYDHCLSPMEVKELAKGLILHYPLNNGGNSMPFGYIELEYIEGNGSSYINLDDYHFNPEIDDCKVIFKSNNVSQNGMIFADSGTKYFWFYYYNSGSAIRLYADNGTGQVGIGNHVLDLLEHTMEYSNKVYILDGEIQGNLSSKTYSADTGTLNLFSYGGGSYGFKGRIYYTDIKQNGVFKKILVPAKRSSDSAIGMYDIINHKFWSSSSSTAFIAGPEKNRMGTIEYDCSGYCNNGEYYAYDTNGSISYTSDTPKYNVSTHIASANPTQNAASGTRYLYGHCGLTNPTQMSVAFWLKPITGGYGGTTSNGQGYFCTTNYEYGNISVGSDYQASAMNHRDGAVDINDSASTTQCRPTFYPTIGEWHHYVITYDGQIGKVYKDGIQSSTAQFSAAKTLDSFIGVVIGFSKAGGVWRRNDACYSDFRIYATALSADDVKSLYQNSAYIDSSGNIYGAVYSEG